ncbi:MAG: hypothetical protein WDO56_27610 [Gammaproteobacteria bacterium]
MRQFAFRTEPANLVQARGRGVLDVFDDVTIEGRVLFLAKRARKLAGGSGGKVVHERQYS